jgi:protein TonB
MIPSARGIGAYASLDLHDRDRARAKTSTRYRSVAALFFAIGLHAAALYFITAQPAEVRLTRQGGGRQTPISVTIVAAPSPSVEPQPVPVVPNVPVKAPKVLATHRPSPRKTIVQETEAVKAHEPPPTKAEPVETPQAPVSISPPTPASSSSTTADNRPSLNLPKPIGEGDLKELGCRIPSPTYPARAKRLGETGTVRLRIQIGTDGRLTGVSVAHSSGFADLDAAAVDAVSSGVCQPYRDHGVAVSVTAEQPVGFDLDR